MGKQKLSWLNFRLVAYKVFFHHATPLPSSCYKLSEENEAWVAGRTGRADHICFIQEVLVVFKGSWKWLMLEKKKEDESNYLRK